MPFKYQNKNVPKKIGAQEYLGLGVSKNCRLLLGSPHAKVIECTIYLGPPFMDPLVFAFLYYNPMSNIKSNCLKQEFFQMIPIELLVRTRL